MNRSPCPVLPLQQRILRVQLGPRAAGVLLAITPVPAGFDAIALRQIRCSLDVSAWIFFLSKLLLSPDQSMASSDSINLENDQENLEWVAPQVSLMEVMDTRGKLSASLESTTLKGDFLRGPS